VKIKNRYWGQLIIKFGCRVSYSVVTKKRNRQTRGKCNHREKKTLQKTRSANQKNRTNKINRREQKERGETPVVGNSPQLIPKLGEKSGEEEEKRGGGPVRGGNLLVEKKRDVDRNEFIRRSKKGFFCQIKNSMHIQ